jgi:hypothetical protein
MHQKPLDRLSIVDFILDLFARRGSDEYMGEPVNMAQHMEQTAACAAADGATNDLVIAALLHDIGHFATCTSWQVLNSWKPIIQPRSPNRFACTLPRKNICVLSMNNISHYYQQLQFNHYRFRADR